MALPIWENLPKNQESNEKIEEAIARAIAAHNANETAHLAEGQSLQSHRASETIDHLVKSIVEAILADGAVSSRALTSDQIIGKDIRTDENVGELVDGVKFNSDGIQMYQDGQKKVDIPTEGNPFFAGNLLASGIFYSKAFKQTNWESIDGWTHGGTGLCNNTWGGVVVRTLNVTNDIGTLYMTSSFARPIDFSNNSPYFQIYLKLSSNSDNEAHFMIGTQTVLSARGGFGFKVTNGTLYAVIFNNLHKESAYEISGVDCTDYHMYRAEMASGESLKFYVDNELKQEVPFSPSIFPSGTAYLWYSIGVKTFSDAYKSIICESLLMCQDF